MFYPQLVKRFVISMWDIVVFLFFVAKSLALESQGISGEHIAADYWRQTPR
jgi:hypothetical protein